MKLTLGQAAKEAGVSKPSLSAAIKNGRLSAHKNESGSYEIDPAELFRVYPPKRESNEEANSKILRDTNPVSLLGLTGKDGVLGLLLAERDKLIEEKDKTIKHLIDEKDKIREDLEDQKEQTKRITVLLEDKSGRKENTWEKSMKALEKRIANQEEAVKENEEKEEKMRRQIRDLKKSLEDEKNKLEAEKMKPWWKKLAG